MLIAIMGNTFDNVKNNQYKSEVEMKIELLSDYVNSIKTKKTAEENKNYLVLVFLNEGDEE